MTHYETVIGLEGKAPRRIRFAAYKNSVMGANTIRTFIIRHTQKAKSNNA